MLTIVGQGLAGTLAAFEAARRGLDFRIVDEGSGATASRAAAGLFNPLTGPRFTADTDGWDRIVPFYRDLEQRLGVALIHEIELVRPLVGASADRFPRSAPGWSAEVDPSGSKVVIWGGGWLDLDALLDAARALWLGQGRLEERRFGSEGFGDRVWWCGGVADLLTGPWKGLEEVKSRWQPVRGDVLTVRIPGRPAGAAEVGPLFLLPLGEGRFRWGATHEIDVADFGFRPLAREQLLRSLASQLGGQPFEVVDHRWGVRSTGRNRSPLVERHPDEPGWMLFNGFGGRGVSLIPRWLERLP